MKQELKQINKMVEMLSFLDMLYDGSYDDTIIEILKERRPKLYKEFENLSPQQMLSRHIHLCEDLDEKIKDIINKDIENQTFLSLELFNVLIQYKNEEDNDIEYLASYIENDNFVNFTTLVDKQKILKEMPKIKNNKKDKKKIMKV